jgi:circadian clock protein KaiB
MNKRTGLPTKRPAASKPRAARAGGAQKTKAKAKAQEASDAAETWNLRLYVAGQSPKCVAAVRNLNRFCEQHLAGRYTVEVIDLLENPQLARDDQILAIPTLVRKIPQPLRKIVGDLSDGERMLVGFDIRAGARPTVSERR